MTLSESIVAIRGCDFCVNVCRSILNENKEPHPRFGKTLVGKTEIIGLDILRGALHHTLRPSSRGRRLTTLRRQTSAIFHILTDIHIFRLFLEAIQFHSKMKCLAFIWRHCCIDVTQHQILRRLLGRSHLKYINLVPISCLCRANGC